MNKVAKKKKKMLLSSRRGVLLLALIAVLVLVINVITASYSWFTPQTVSNRGLDYTFTGKMRSENCSMSTYIGTKVTSQNKQDGEYLNQIRYADSASSGTVSVSANQTAYFKTEIINADTNNASDISLYISSIPACTLAVTYPGNSVRSISSTQTDYYIVRDAYVKRKDNADVNGPGKLEIEWFVTAGSSAITVNLSNLYLLYN